MLDGKRITLDARLEKIADMLGYRGVCADIGCDHGRLGAYLLQNGRCERIYLTDISKDSLEKARRLIRLLGYEDRAVIRAGDGAQALEGPVEAAVIAGMGGETIADIVEAAGERFDGTTLILQPNVGADELRWRLNTAHWRITDEAIVREGRRLYPIIQCVRGEQELSKAECAAGPVLLARRDPMLAAYAGFILNYTERALRGAEQGGDAASVDRLRAQKRIWEEIKACL